MGKKRKNANYATEKREQARIEKEKENHLKQIFNISENNVINNENQRIEYKPIIP